MLELDHPRLHAATLQSWWLLLVVATVGLIWSGTAPLDRATWTLEVFPVVFALLILWPTRKRFPLTPLLYVLIAIHASILMLGGHYTYAEVPLGNWLRDLFDLQRNHYDRLGHLAQGFIPAMIARELLLRKTPLLRGAWLFFLVTCVCLALSAVYEFLEWWTALIGGGSADAFLGTQGDVWDTQWDMFLATCGAIAAQLILASWHDRQLRRFTAGT